MWDQPNHERPTVPHKIDHPSHLVPHATSLVERGIISPIYLRVPGNRIYRMVGLFDLLRVWSGRESRLLLRVL